MRYFPIFMDLKDQHVLVVGGGMVGERKIRLLRKAGAKVSLVSRELTETVHQWVREGGVEWLASEYDQPHLFGQRLVFAATDDALLNRRVYVDAEKAGIPVNVVDDREHCRFISPAVIDRSPVQVAVSTGGSAPVLARMLRNWIEKLLPAGLGKVADAASALRGGVRKRISAEHRRSAWEAALTEENIRFWSNQDPETVKWEMNQALEQEAPGARTRRPGKVYLVGAGPGRADLLTLRAHELLGRADVVLYDRLVAEEVLDRARRDAELVYVGKQAGNHHRTQDEIHDLLKSFARQGRTVVRLKGGDPFIFGRGGEEIEVLREAGIDYEVVPGITAATGCAAYAGIPLTHRDHAKALTFVTGHLVSGDVDWAGIAGKDRTAVVYMGLKQAEVLREAMLRAGISRNLPVALVCDGTRESQTTLHGNLNQLPALAAQAPEGSAALLIIGQVTALGCNLGWFRELKILSNAA